MAKGEIKITIGLWIVFLAGLFWMGFGIFEFLSDTSSPAGLIEAGLVGGVLILTGLFAYRWRYCGGWVLVFIGMIPVFLNVSRGYVNPIVLLILAGPPLVSGMLFLLD